MSPNFRTQQLLDRVPAGPHADKVKAAISAALEAASAFGERRQELSRSGKYTDAGLKEQLTSELQKGFAPKLNNARRPVKALRQRLEALKAEIKPKVLDKTDLVGELQRQELRAYMLDLKPGNGRSSPYQIPASQRRRWARRCN